MFDIELDGADREGAEAALKDAAEKLLANTVIENYRVELVESSDIAVTTARWRTEC